MAQAAYVLKLFSASFIKAFRIWQVRFQYLLQNTIRYLLNGDISIVTTTYLLKVMRLVRNFKCLLLSRVAESEVKYPTPTPIFPKFPTPDSDSLT